jgi:acyl carrier protein
VKFMDYQAEFINMLKTKTGKKDIIGTTDLRSLGIDSLDLVEIVMEAEEKFKITFSNDELNGFKTVDDVVKAISQKI